MNRKYFFKAGFWGSFGFLCGISSVIAIIFGLIGFSIYFKEWKNKIGFEWERLWYSEEERKFDDCFRKEYDFWRKLPNDRVNITDETKFEKYLKGGSPKERCIRKGFKPF